ncbi:MAG: C40 family peptidase [Coriobacteriales bacterium]|jgi:cell wall-associated NlpC family hydrolase|nr:C40 family peptidase [Coriobacteriales bacterium]
MPESFNTIECSGISPENKTSISRRSFMGLAAVVAAVAIATSDWHAPSTAFATPSEDKRLEADAVRRRLDEWEALLNQYSNDYYAALAEYDQAITDLDAAAKHYEETVINQDRIQTQLGQRVRYMYKDGQLTFLNVIFGSHTFYDFTANWDFFNLLNRRDADLIAEANRARDNAEQALASLKIKEQIAVQKLAEAEEIRRNAVTIVNSYRAELEKLEDEVRQLIEEERLAEEERLRQEWEALSNQRPSNPGTNVEYQDEIARIIVEAAYSRLGCPYVWAASGPNAFDCSGLTSWCYRQAGLSIPRGGNAQYFDAPMRLAVVDAKPGDILFKPGHVGLYIGGGKFIHAPNPSTVVKITEMAGYGWHGASRWQY